MYHVLIMYSKLQRRSIGNDIFSLSNDKIKNIINNISKLYSSLSTGRYQKSTILSLVASEFSPSQLSSFGFEFSRTQFNTAKQKAREDQFTLDDYQRHIPKSRSAVGQTIVDLVKSYLHRYSQPSSMTGRRVGEESNGFETRSDSGPHFKNSEFLYAVMKALPESFPRKNFFLYYFLENHGKSYVDGHFGVLSKWFDESESIMDITSIDDLMGIFRLKTSDLAAQRGIYTDDVGYNFIKYDQYTHRGYKYKMSIDSFENYLSFFKINNYLMAYPISTMSPSDYEPKNFRLKVYKDVRNDRFAPSAPSISPNECVIMGLKSYTVHNSRVLWLKNHTNTTS
ncbi:hypothetical protein AYI70_g9888 [Smittium culicis]|uniref:Uncharacterized protein n=1 Tax=Smittium culicis TaxID=133412 RepID=A0A1R1X959_9FUNG|nr:hypothetical protein AYI70_g9888 [Smittium culicis]